MSSGLKMPKSMNKFFCKIYILAKKVKYISKIPVIRAKVSGKIIHIDLVGLITLIRYNGSKYSLLLIDIAIRVTTGVLLKEKRQVKVELPKYTENLQI